ncbi:MAG: hypothetical protein AABY87_04250 [bacterium]
MKILGLILLIFFLLLCGFALYYKATYIDESVEAGEGFGFIIGSSKTDAYSVSKKLFKDKKVYILNPINEKGLGPQELFNFSNGAYQIIANRDLWEFYFANNFLDFLRLEFKGGILIKIYRHKQPFELP